MQKIDLHIHSNFSDGEKTPLEIFEIVKKNNVKLFSITDHNYISPYTKELTNLSKENGINFITGIEVSCVDRISGKSLHILGYGNDLNIQEINSKMQSTLDGYNNRAKKIIEKINSKYLGINLDFDYLKNNSNEAYISRNTIAYKLYEFLKDENIILKDLLKECFVEENDNWMLDSQEAIKIIKEAGGVAVLAHSGKLFEFYQDFEILLQRLIQYGISGLEVFYSKHTDYQKNGLFELSKKYNLFYTAGSDYHGDFYTKGIDIGIVADFNGNILF